MTEEKEKMVSERAAAMTELAAERAQRAAIAVELAEERAERVRIAAELAEERAERVRIAADLAEERAEREKVAMELLAERGKTQSLMARVSCLADLSQQQQLDIEWMTGLKRDDVQPPSILRRRRQRG
jgi:hypothetical protein